MCNPFECLIFGAYLIACIVFNIKLKAYKKKTETASCDEAIQASLKYETLERLFGFKAFLKITVGLSIAAVISVIFFFATGGTIAGLLENIPNLLSEESHDVFSSPLVALLNKIFTSITHFNAISFGLPFILPVLYLALLFDKKRQEVKRKFVYICITFAISVFYTVGIAVGALSHSRRFAIALPFFIVASVCYILTKEKNKKLFYCMWLPSVVATFIQHLASDMHLSVFWVLTIANIAGVFFVKDFVSELRPALSEEQDIKAPNIHKRCLLIITIAICLQLAFQSSLYMVGRTVKLDYEKLERGPYAGLLLEQENLQRNNSIMDDLDIIKQRTDSDDPVLVISEFSWMYLYLERPFATYSAWQPVLEIDRLETYFNLNPEKKPKYIYVCWVYIQMSITAGHGTAPERAQKNVDILLESFEGDVEKLSNGFLISVK